MNDTKEKESAPELLSQYLSMAKELLWKDELDRSGVHLELH
jgi:hypothetical protein